MAEPFSDEELKNVQEGISGEIKLLKEKLGPVSILDHDRLHRLKYHSQRLLDTIAARDKRIELMEAGREMYCPQCKTVYPLSGIPAKPSGIVCKKCSGILRSYPEWKLEQQTATIKRLRGALEPVWIVNDIAELGVKIGGRLFFLYKGGNIEYDTHDNGTPMKYRIVGKREFGETCQPKAYFDKNYHLTESGLYTEPLIYHEGLSDGKPEDGEWKQLPARQAIDEKE